MHVLFTLIFLSCHTAPSLYDGTFPTSPHEGYCSAQLYFILVSFSKHWSGVQEKMGGGIT